MKSPLLIIVVSVLLSALVSYVVSRRVSIRATNESIARLEVRVLLVEEHLGIDSDESILAAKEARVRSKSVGVPAGDGSLSASPRDGGAGATQSGLAQSGAAQSGAGFAGRPGGSPPSPAVQNPTINTSAASGQPPSAETTTSASSPTTFGGRSLDVPGPTDRHCEFATINSDTQMTRSLIWDPLRGGVVLGNVPAGSVVEILSSHLERWVDFPGEHGVLVRVARSSLKEMENQTGYIELRRINNRVCNLGPDFEM